MVVSSNLFDSHHFSNNDRKIKTLAQVLTRRSSFSSAGSGVTSRLADDITRTGTFYGGNMLSETIKTQVEGEEPRAPSLIFCFLTGRFTLNICNNWSVAYFIIYLINRFLISFVKDFFVLWWKIIIFAFRSQRNKISEGKWKGEVRGVERVLEHLCETRVRACVRVRQFFWSYKYVQLSFLWIVVLFPFSLLKVD